MKKLFAILCLLAAVGAAQAIDYGTPYTGSTPQIYTQPVQTSMTIGGYSTVATGGMTTTGEGSVISGAMRIPVGSGSNVGDVRYDDGGKPFIWDGSNWVSNDDDDEETNRPELDIVPVGDTIWPLMLMAMAFLLLRLRRRKQQEA